MEDMPSGLLKFILASSRKKEPDQERLRELDLMFATVLRPQGLLQQVIQLAQRRAFLLQLASCMDDGSCGFIFGAALMDPGLVAALRANEFTVWREKKGRVVIGLPGVAPQQLDLRQKRDLQGLVPSAVPLTETLLGPLRPAAEERAEIEQAVKQLFVDVPEPAKGFQHQYFLSQRTHLVSALAGAVRKGGGVALLEAGHLSAAFFPALASAGCALWLEKTTYCQFVSLPGITQEMLHNLYGKCSADDDDGKKLVFEAVPLESGPVDLKESVQ